MSNEVVEEEEELEYSVEAIRGWRYHFSEKRKEFLIKWLGFPDDQNTWEPEENLNCPEVFDAFLRSLSTEELRYFNYPRPEKLNGFQRNAKFLKFVGVDGPHESDEDEGSAKPMKYPFYILAHFDDSDQAEEVTLDEYYRYKPEEAFRFCEERLMLDDTDSEEGSSEYEN